MIALLIETCNSRRRSHAYLASAVPETVNGHSNGRLDERLP
jgi:hypothetical protein